MARLNLSRHWKFRRLTRAVGSPVVARGHLELLWEAAYEAASDYIGTAADIADAAGWTGAPDAFVTILVEAEFLDEPAPGVYQIHDLWDHVPPFVKLRWTRAHPDQTPPWHDPAPIADAASHACDKPISSVQKNRTCTGRVGTGQEREEQRAASASPSLPLDEDAEANDLAPRRAGTPMLPVATPVRATRARPPAVLLRAGFAVREQLPSDATDADFKEDLKGMAARARLPFDGAAINDVLDFVLRVKPLQATLAARRAQAQSGRRRA